jgi:hypothetical protein
MSEFEAPLRGTAFGIASQPPRAIVEDEVTVVVPAGADAVGIAGVDVEVQRNKQVPDDLIVQRSVEPVTHIAGGRSPLAGEPAAGRDAERPVGVVVVDPERVVHEQRRPLPVDARRTGRYRQQRPRIHGEGGLQLVLPGAAIGKDLDHVAEGRIGTDAIHRSVQVVASILIRAAQVGIHRAHLKPRPRDALIDTRADAGRARQLEIVAEHVAADRQRDAEVVDRGNLRIRRIADVDLALAKAVHAQGLLVGAPLQPVVEDPPARTHHRGARAERRPGEADARHQAAEVLHVALRLVTSAGADGEISPDLDVVLHVDRSLHRLIANQRLADAAGIAARPARVVGGEALERVGTQIVRRVVGADGAAIDEDARAQRMDAADVVEVGAEGEAE